MYADFAHKVKCLNYCIIKHLIYLQMIHYMK